jgi:hypothetical protein
MNIFKTGKLDGEFRNKFEDRALCMVVDRAYETILMIPRWEVCLL